MTIIGLTGPSGAGKTSVCSVFNEIDIPCIDTDAVYHSIVNAPSPCTSELSEYFGSEVLNADGSLNRKALAEIVFTGENAENNLNALNNITHKYVWKKTNELLTQYISEGKRAAVIDAPALFSSKMFIGKCDLIISVIADRELRLERIEKRDGLTAEQAEARLSAQPNDEFFIKNSDFYIDNSSSLAKTRKQLLSILKQEDILA